MHLTPDLIIVAIRLLVPLLILRFSLFGAIASIFVDYYDFELIKFLDNGNLSNYQYLDKNLDMYYLAIEAYVASHWINSYQKYTAFLLFFYRAIGFSFFLSSGHTWILVFFPNIFEWFYLYVISYKRIFKKDPITSFRKLVGVLIILTIPKVIHEYLLHINTIHPWWKVPLQLVNKS